MTRRHRRCAAVVLPIALAAMAAGAALADAPPELPDDPTLDDFLAVAEARNPGLEASRREWEAASSRVGQAGSFPDPILSLGTMLSEVETRVGPQKETVVLMQRLPWFGKLGLREEAASRAAEAVGAGWEERRLDLRRDVALAWYELYWLGRAIALSEANLDLLANLERVVREKYRIADVSHADLVRVQVELGLQEDRVRSLKDRLAPTIARMNALLHRPVGASVPLPRTLRELPPPPSRENLVGALREASPRLAASEHRVGEAVAARELAGREQWPDWTVGVKWIRVGEAVVPVEDSGKDALMVDVTVELPIFRGKYSGAIREAEEKLASTRSSRDREEDELVGRAEALLFAWQDADRRASLYRGALLPKARESLEATTIAYRTGKGGFLDLIEAQRVLLDLELEGERALTDRGRAAVELGALAGKDWNEEAPR